MKLHQQFLTNNNCYKAGKKIKVKGLMLHSTGANNPKLSRYISPDDGHIGTPSSNNWNQPKPGGREVCVHGFIGLDKDGIVRTYQTLPWNHRGWHSGGSANDTHISVEICEDNLKDADYFAAVYEEAVELFAYLCKEYGLTEKNILDHSEGHKKGIASNHGDVMHWFPKHGKTMDTFRADVKKVLNGGTVEVEQTPSQSPSVGQSITSLAQDVIAGKYGSGEERKKALGDAYDEVQAMVNSILSGSGNTTTVAPEPAPTAKTVDQLAKEVIEGKHGYGADRKKSLGDRYQEVQARVNELLGTSKSNTTKSVATLADEVIKGLHGSGRERMISLGNKYAAVQAEVNRRMK